MSRTKLTPLLPGVPVYGPGVGRRPHVQPAVIVIPPSTGKVDGVGIVRYAGTLPSTGHLDVYDFIDTDWLYAYIAAAQPGLSFAYRNLGPPGYNPINLSNPSGFISECLDLKSQYPGLDGIFLDNCNSWDSGTHLPFMQAVCPTLKASGLLVLPNAMASGSNQNNGGDDRAWYSQIGQYATHIMIEYWQQARGGPDIYKRRLRGSATYSDYWDEWQTNVAAIHAVGCKAVMLSFRAVDPYALYCRASMLLVAGPGDVYCHTLADTPDGPDPYDTRWLKSYGDPIDPAGSNPRRFQNGTVSVDPVAGTGVLG